MEVKRRHSYNVLRFCTIHISTLFVKLMGWENASCKREDRDYHGQDAREDRDFQRRWLR